MAITPPTEPGIESYSSSISDDGRYVALDSSAANLVPDDTNGAIDIFVFDRQTGSTSRVSVGSAGEQGNGPSSMPAISGDGRYVAFASGASNLVLGDTNGSSDIFVHDRETGMTSRVSVDGASGESNGNSDAPAISADARYVAFQSVAWNLVAGDVNWDSDVFVHDRLTGSTTRASVNGSGTGGSSDSIDSAISADGRFVVFSSSADNLVAGDTNDRADIFLRDRTLGVTTRLSVTSSGLQANRTSSGPSISSDGCFVAFWSDATDLVPDDSNVFSDVFVHDRLTGVTARASVSSAGQQATGASFGSAISPDGRYVAFASSASNLVANDTNGGRDTFVRDLQTGTTERISASSTQVEGGWASSYSPFWSPALSGDGRFVAFGSLQSNLVVEDTNRGSDIFVRDRLLNTTERTPELAAPPPNGALLLADAHSEVRTRSLSWDGHYVAFETEATNLVEGDSNSAEDVFVRDVREGTTTRASVNSEGEQGNGASFEHSLSNDGQHVAFSSSATNLVSGDTNGVQDVFVRNLTTGTTVRVSVSSSGGQATNLSSAPSISGDGRFVAFLSRAGELASGGIGNPQVYVRDLFAGTTIRASVDVAGNAATLETYAPDISADGRFVAFSTVAALVPNDSDGVSDIYLRDLQAGATIAVSFWPSLPIGSPSVSSDGRFLAAKVGLAEGSGAQVHDRQLGTTANLGGNWVAGPPAISTDGGFVVFTIYNFPNTIDTVYTSRRGGRTVIIPSDVERRLGGYAVYANSVSGNGRSVAFSSEAAIHVPGGDWGTFRDVFIHDTAVFVDGFDDGDFAAWSLAEP